MWIRLQLDIGWLDLVRAYAYCLSPLKQSTASEQAKQSWNSQDNFLIALSVRSAFDLLLRALQLPEGSEVLMTALTVPDMVRIVKMHGLVPIPVEVDADGTVSTESLRRAISPQTRMIVVAHLFGGSAPLEQVFEFAQQHDFLVVEDCAQSFHKVGDSADTRSDAALFSFGPIKTASALGGAVARIKSPELCKQMVELLGNDPIQSRFSYMTRLVRFTALKLLSGQLAASLIKFCVEKMGGDFDSVANSAVRGFGAANLSIQLRRQPSVPLLTLLKRRWLTYDFARIDHRIKMGRYLDDRIGIQRAPCHSYWVYPIFVHDSTTLRDRFRSAGFDATCKARMAVVPAADGARQSVATSEMWKRVLFLPWYPEMSQRAVDEMAALIHSAPSQNTEAHEAKLAEKN